MHSVEICSIVIIVSAVVTSSRLPLKVFSHHHVDRHHHHHHRLNHNSTFTQKIKSESTEFRILYQLGKSESELPVCSSRAVCNKIDLYEIPPWMERQCRCPQDQTCPSSLDDGHTLSDKTRRYKLCEPIKKLPKCRYFHDITWTLQKRADNTTEQIVHCHCPKNSVTYLKKRQASQIDNGRIGYQFACSPQSRSLCQRKEPCRLFTVRKRQEFLDEVNTDTLCQCPHAHRCPHHHTDYGVLLGKTYTEEAIRTYSGYCIPTAV